MKTTSALYRNFLIIFAFQFLLNNSLNAQSCAGYTAAINKTSDGFYFNDVSLQVTVSGGSGTINKVIWDPLGYYSYTDNISTHYRGAGTYRAIVEDTFYGCIDTAYITVSDSFSCHYMKANLSQSDSCYYNDLTVHASVPVGSGSYAYKWSTGDTTSSLFSRTTGTFSVTITDRAHGCVDSTSFSAIDDTCNFCIHFRTSYNESDSCWTNDMNLSVYGNNYNQGVYSKITYKWNTGDTTNYLYHAASGAYSVTIVDVNYGCRDTIAFTAKDDTCDPCKVYFRPYIDGNEGCKANDVYVRLSGVSSYDTSISWQWNTGDTALYLYGKPSGTYTVTVSENNYGCKDTLSVTVHDSVYRCCSANFSLASDTINGAGSNLIGFTNLFISNAYTSNYTPLKYLWSFGDGYEGSGKFNSHQYANTGTKVICHFIEDTVGCKDTICKTKNLPASGLNLGVKTFRGAYVPGQPTQFYIYYANLGNTIATGATIKLYHPAGLTVNSASNIYSVGSNSIDFNLGTLNIGQYGHILVNMKTPSTYTVGSVVIDSTIITPLSGDVLPTNNILINYDLVRGSYDPNEILVSPNGIGEEGKISLYTKELGYLIHFQNEGTWRTYKVRVENEVDPSLDLSSLFIGDVSHGVRLVLNGRKLIWNFDDIHLTPKSEDEGRSQGFIQYTIKIKPNMPRGTLIKNTAYIYFDYNPAIVTNTANSTLYLKIGDGGDGTSGSGGAIGGVNNASVSAIDNAKIDFMYELKGEDLLVHSEYNIDEFSIYDLSGKIVRIAYPNSRAFELKEVDLSKGVYIIHAKIGENKLIKKIQF